MDGDKALTARYITYEDSTYYVDYEDGSDQADGLSEVTPWQHAPGDPNATGVPAKTAVGPGNKVLFKGGVVYRGQIKLAADGSQNHPVRYQGNAWGAEKAIIDGGDLISGWTSCVTSIECGTLPDAGKLYYAYLPAEVDQLGLNLHERHPDTSVDEFIWLAQDPDPSDPYFFDQHEEYRPVDLVLDTSKPLGTRTLLTRTSLIDEANFNQADPNYWNDSYLLIWINPDKVVSRKILSFDPATDKVSFDDLGENAIYTGRLQQAYATFNSRYAINKAGEYFVAATPDTNSNRKLIILYPHDSTDLDNRISYSARKWGFDLASRSHLKIDGFDIRKHAGTGTRSGVGIGTISNSHLNIYDIVVRDNFITHNSGMRGYIWQTASAQASRRT